MKMIQDLNNKKSQSIENNKKFSKKTFSSDR